MEKLLKIFIVVITVLGSWFQESKYSDMHFDIDEAIHVHSIAGEDYILLTDELNQYNNFDVLIDDLNTIRRTSLQTKYQATYSKDQYNKCLVDNFFSFAPPLFFCFTSTSPKQLIGYGWLYLCSLF